MNGISFGHGNRVPEHDNQDVGEEKVGRMKISHARALQSYAQALQRLLALRLGVQLVTAWFFIWGVVVLALRIFGLQNVFRLALGILVIVPLILFAVFYARRLNPEFARLRASYDRLNECGGIVMAQESGDMSAWFNRLPDAVVPKFRWHGGRALFLLLVATFFLAITLLLPERLTRFSLHRSLEVGQVVQQLQAEVKTLAQEKIVDDKKSAELEKQLAQLQNDASGFDPDKTWEALDHIKQADADAAKAAMDEAMTKNEALAKAETLAKAMQQAADNGMEPAVAAEAAQDLATMLDEAKLEDGILNNKIPPELLSGLTGLKGLNQEQLQKLMQALQANQNALQSMAGDLANMKMIDPATLAKMQAAGDGFDTAGLADYLAHCKGGSGDDELFSWFEHPGKGGPGGGGPEADMTWKDGSSEKDLKFQAHALPPAAKLSSAQIVGVSRAAPQLSDNDVTVQHGALADAAAGGGSAHAQVILPEQRQAVQNFFKRDP